MKIRTSRSEVKEEFEREEFLQKRSELITGENMFRTMDGETLLNKPLEAPPFLVSHLIPQGLHILGGAPKIGKSWLVLWMCLQIAKGKPIWNYETQQGTVLYLALEDSFERLQSRLLEITDDAPNCLHFAVLAKSIANGLDKQIESFIEMHPDTKLIAIDTLQYIRSTDNTLQNPYANDYKDLMMLKELALNYHIAILLVHHLRKQKDIDPLNMLSGTTGLSGAVDSVYILDRPQRTESFGTLFCSGRDIETVEIKLDFSEDEFIWKLIDGNPAPIKMLDDVIVTVDNYFSSADKKCFCGTATELAERIKKQTGVDLVPAILSKRLLQFYTQFCSLGYFCSFGRTNHNRFIVIEHVASQGDGSDGKNETDPCVPASVTPSQEVCGGTSLTSPEV